MAVSEGDGGGVTRVEHGAGRGARLDQRLQVHGDPRLGNGHVHTQQLGHEPFRTPTEKQYQTCEIIITGAIENV